MQAILSAQSKSEFLNHVYWVPLSWASTLTVKAFEQVSTIDTVFLYSLYLISILITSHYELTFLLDFVMIIIKELHFIQSFDGNP